jgi:2-polyprenyl-6-hydroxyphenyl methylase/3-demethylubiquinone-9 3-methyltransferase
MYIPARGTAMPIDNRLYDALADSWWDEAGCLHVLRGLNTARFGFLRRVLVEELGLDVRGRKTLDVGCGGGLLAEELARLGCEVTGIDPSAPSLEAARAHARTAGLDIDYRQAPGEHIPFPDAAFDVVYCCDVLEHVENLRQVIAEISRVLKPGGIFLYDTINRTWKSKLVVIELFQEWDWTSFMPPHLHDWRMFIKPDELISVMAAAGLESRGLTGFAPSVNPFRALRLLRARKRGEISYAEAARRLGIRESRNLAVLYAGYACKA